MILLFIVGCNKVGEDIEILNPYARIAPKDGSSAVYMKIKNNQGMEDTLYEAYCNCANITELHETIKKGDMMEMKKIDYLVIKDKLSLEPGGLHVMLINLKEDLRENDTIELVLKFKKSGEKKIKVPVKKLE
ncbi:MAG: copper chaperone PCu(A)C [candidate division WOR-3 bacterium]|nr:copper chaperone PCu(A)C [candidate division WOR-3 bacterium]MDW8149922.1 copper chaperone PCu(A)C [candidate division WOR-3 bacterium]